MDSVYDRALVEIGNNNRYQKQYDILYNVGLVLLWSMVYTNIILCLTIVPHMCKIPDNSENITEYSWKQKNIPTYIDIAGEVHFDSCLLFTSTDNHNHTKDCNDFVYDKTWYESTVSTENNWVCGNELYVANILSFSKIGETLGSIVFGWLGDAWGRRPTLLLSLFMIIAGRFLSLIGKNSYIIFMIGCIISAFPSWSVPQSASLISVEFSSSSRRTVITTLRFASYSIGMALMALIFWGLRDWKLLLIATTASLMPYLFLCWKLIESPRWLHTRGRNKECVRALKLIAEKNRMNLTAETEAELLMSIPDVDKACITLNYTVLVLRAGEKSDGNPFVNFAWQCVVEVPSNFIGAWLADSIGRRKTGAISNLITAAMWAIILLRDTTSISLIRHWLFSSIIVIIGRLSIFVSYYALSLFSIELYPTGLRQTGMAYGNIISSCASAVAPYILFMGRRYDIRVPAIILTIASIIAVASSLLLPETLNVKLPETLEEAQNFGKRSKAYEPTDIQAKDNLLPLQEIKK
ncbi:organic cation transporter protein isoform X2 [Aricia agestis]|uniref:organic cation transporter protein isoform X2 n=1 Tax=Aricia agestis TaxID=91739 RepID=UPI001C207E8F|nr:organic cation transporter protein isoform X2 [Aricia agestis]